MNYYLSGLFNVLGFIGNFITRLYLHYVILFVMSFFLIRWLIKKKKVIGYVAIVFILVFNLYTLTSIKGATQYFYLWYGRPVSAYANDVKITKVSKDGNVFSVESTGDFIHEYGSQNNPLDSLSIHVHRIGIFYFSGLFTV